jgi:hypothetical protein
MMDHAVERAYRRVTDWLELVVGNGHYWVTDVSMEPSAIVARAIAAGRPYYDTTEDGIDPPILERLRRVCGRT